MTVTGFIIQYFRIFNAILANTSVKFSKTVDSRLIELLLGGTSDHSSVWPIKLLTNEDKQVNILPLMATHRESPRTTQRCASAKTD